MWHCLIILLHKLKFRIWDHLRKRCSPIKTDGTDQKRTLKIRGTFKENPGNSNCLFSKIILLWGQISQPVSEPIAWLYKFISQPKNENKRKNFSDRRRPRGCRSSALLGHSKWQKVGRVRFLAGNMYTRYNVMLWGIWGDAAGRREPSAMNNHSLDLSMLDLAKHRWF